MHEKDIKSIGYQELQEVIVLNYECSWYIVVYTNNFVQVFQVRSVRTAQIEN